MVATLTDKIGTEVEEIRDKLVVSSLYNKVPRVFENEVVVRLPYCYYSTYDIDPGFESGQFKVNSIYDPDLSNTFGNGQPLGRDTWANIYNYYKVLKTHIKIECGDLSVYNTNGLATGVNATPSMWGGMLDITANPPGSLSQWMNAERAGNSNRQQIFTRPQLSHVIQGCGGDRSISYEMDWNPTLFETSILDQSSKDTWTPVGSDPDNLEYFSAISFNPSNTARNVYYKIQIEFLVAFKQVNRTLLNTTN